jgi:AAA+ superfamily predicted ATPase
MVPTRLSLPTPAAQARELALLLAANHPVIVVETAEDERAEALVEHVARELDLLHGVWTPHRGIEFPSVGTTVAGTEALDKALDHLAAARTEAVVFLTGRLDELREPATAARLRDVQRALWQHRGAIVLAGAHPHELPEAVRRIATTVRLPPPSEAELHQYVSQLLKQAQERGPVAVHLDGGQVAALLHQLRGLTYPQVRRIVSLAIAEHGLLDARVVAEVHAAKRSILRESGVLELAEADRGLDDVAGNEGLKAWLQARRAHYADPVAAARFGLAAPRGLLLLGVPGCGKSLSVRAAARTFGLPLVRLDPSRLYSKYVGETEKNLAGALATAEAMAPLVLWIDEIEKAFDRGSGGGDAGLSQRVFGSFLTWLQEKPAGVFVFATCNDVSGLPPELVRKGRFDELFFVDLPHAAARRAILALHLQKRGRNPIDFDLDALAETSVGFTGAELEQAIVAALYAAFGEQVPLATRHLEGELRATRPLAITMAESIAALRAWCDGRAVRADAVRTDTVQTEAVRARASTEADGDPPV